MELTEAQKAVAIQSPGHLRRWVAQARPFVVFVGVHLVDGLPFPSGHQTFQHIVTAYTHQRATIPTGAQEVNEDGSPMTYQDKDAEGRPIGPVRPVLKMCDDRLTVAEMKECVAWLAGQIHETEPDWTF